MKNTLQRIWRYKIMNPWWWLLVATVVVPIALFLALTITLTDTLIHPERIGEFFGKIVAGFNKATP